MQQIADPDSTSKMESGSFTMSAVWDCPENEWQTNHSGRENGRVLFWWGIIENPPCHGEHPPYEVINSKSFK